MFVVEAGFILDASGFGRVLPRLLELETPSKFPVRGAIFTHVEDRIAPRDFDRNKILITVHPDHVRCMVLADSVCRRPLLLGVVGETEFLARYQGTRNASDCRALIATEPRLTDCSRGRAGTRRRAARRLRRQR